jgi:ubiquinone/menaquinone biosynthesis C-methylase UbiE
MKSNPYEGVPKEIEGVMRSLISKAHAYHTVHTRRMARTHQLLLEKSPKGKLLELGTSNLVPLVLDELAPELEVHVTDFNLDQPEVGRKVVALEGKSKEVDCYRVDLEQTPLPIADETFDYVLCCEVIEHMELDPMFMLSEANRVLKSGGVLILTTPNITSSRAISKILRGVEPYFYMQYHVPVKLHRHNYEYSTTSLAKTITSAGFSGQIWTEDSFEDAYMKDVNKLRGIGYALPQVGDNIFAVVRKVGPVVDRYPSPIYTV